MTDHKQLRDEVLGPIRREAGWPEDSAEPLTNDEVNRYIELLENQVVGNDMALQMMRKMRRTK